MKVSRKMDQLVKFFKQVVSDPKVGMRTRMEAAKRLDSIYERAELLHEKAEMRKERASIRAIAQRTQEGVLDTRESLPETNGLNEDERLSQVFDSILSPKGTDDTDSECE